MHSNKFRKEKQKMNKNRIKLLTALLLLLSGISSFAQKITIQEAAEMAVKNNKDIKVGMLEVEQGQIDVASNLMTLLEGSKNAKRIQETKVQDPYTLRCIPQIHGASRDAFKYVFDAVDTSNGALPAGVTVDATGKLTATIPNQDLNITIMRKFL